VLWLRFDAATLALGLYLWFGSDAGAPAPSLGEMVTGLKAPLLKIRVLKQAQFRLLPTIDDVATVIFALRPISSASITAN
jgi:hypothetical protein